MPALQGPFCSGSSGSCVVLSCHCCWRLHQSCSFVVATRRHAAAITGMPDAQQSKAAVTALGLQPKPSCFAVSKITNKARMFSTSSANCRLRKLSLCKHTIKPSFATIQVAQPVKCIRIAYNLQPSMQLSRLRAVQRCLKSKM